MRILALAGLATALTVCLGGCTARLPAGDADARASSSTAYVPVVARLTRAELPREQYVGVAECAEVAEREAEYDRHSVAVFVGYTFERGEGGASVGAD